MFVTLAATTAFLTQTDIEKVLHQLAQIIGKNKFEKKEVDCIIVLTL